MSADVNAVLQFMGLIGAATLLFICLLLAVPKNVHYFIAAGQDVFKWIAVVLVGFLVARLLGTGHVVGSDLARAMNSVVFLISVIGIIWSVSRHGRPSR